MLAMVGNDPLFGARNASAGKLGARLSDNCFYDLCSGPRFEIREARHQI
jgi:hypothetical protein